MLYAQNFGFYRVVVFNIIHAILAVSYFGIYRHNLLFFFWGSRYSAFSLRFALWSKRRQIFPYSLHFFNYLQPNSNNTGTFKRKN